MVEKKTKEKPKTPKVVEKVEEEVEEEVVPKTVSTPAPSPTPRKPTLKEKIDRTVNDWKDSPEELKKQLFGLVQRVLYPDQFCPDCDDRLFLNGQAYTCTNCGYQRTINDPAVISNTSPTINVPPGRRPSDVGAIPKEVENVINQADEAMKNTPRRGGTTPMGAKIQKLVAERDAGGPQQVTPQDEAAVRRDKNTSNKINWV